MLKTQSDFLPASPAVGWPLRPSARSRPLAGWLIVFCRCKIPVIMHIILDDAYNWRYPGWSKCLFILGLLDSVCIYLCSIQLVLRFFDHLLVHFFIDLLAYWPIDEINWTMYLSENHSLHIWTPWHNRDSLCKCPFGVTWFPRTSSYFTRFDVYCSYRCIAVAPLSIVIRTDIDFDQFVRVWRWCHFDG